jgi:uncharacterized protein YbjT (DUF2867 family)
MANTSLKGDLTLVIGGTGKTGRRLADLLRQAGHRVRIGSRNAEPRFDWENRETWRPALQGVKAAYVAYQPDLAAPGALETVDAFFRKAVDSGGEKLVLLSGRGEVEAEQALQATGADWTILRASWFCQNFSEGVFLDAIVAGEVALPSTAAAEPFVDVDDIADIAFAALTDPGHSRRLYEITGSRALTFAEAIGEIAQAAGLRRHDDLQRAAERSAGRGGARAGSGTLVALSRCVDRLESCPHGSADRVGDPVHRRAVPGLKKETATMSHRFRFGPGSCVALSPAFGVA